MFNWWSFAFGVINFFIVLFILYRLLFKPIKRVIQEREEIINKRLGMVTQKEKEALKLKQKYEKELKNIYDIFDLRVIISGSSALSINHAKADLSRRVLKKEVKGLSFREFLEFSGLSMEDLSFFDIFINNFCHYTHLIF